MSYHYAQRAPYYQALGISWGDLNPAKWIGKGAGKILPGATKTADKAVTKVKGTICNFVQTPGAAQGAAVAGGPYGAVGVIGATAACGPGQPPTLPMFPPTMSMMPILLAVGAVVVIAAVTKKPRKETAP